MFFYYQQVGGNEAWKPAPASQKASVIADVNPMFVTVLNVSKLVEDLSYEDKQKLKYDGPLYFDFDGPDIDIVAAKVNQMLDKFEAMRLDLDMVRLYATGSKGFHIEIPQGCFMEKYSKDGLMNLPTIYREMALELYVDTLDFRVYSQSRGRMWRRPGVRRDNGKQKVQLTLDQMRGMTTDEYLTVTSNSRPELKTKMPTLCIDLAIMFTKAQQKVEDGMKKKAKFKADPTAKSKAKSASVSLMQMGVGIKPDAGFQYLAMQLAIAATTAGTPMAEFVSECTGLIETHESNGNRYNTEGKRRLELERMYQYVDDNPMYEFSVGAIKSLLSHHAPDLDGIATTVEELEQGIEEAKTNQVDTSGDPDEYADVTSGVTLSKYGVYVDSEFGKRRICAVSFDNTEILRSTETSEMLAYSTDVLVNGVSKGNKKLEPGTFATLQGFNAMCSLHGHAFLGNDMQLKGTFMSFIAQAKKKGGDSYLSSREGLDVLSIPHHDNPELRKPFLVWSDASGVIPDQRAAAQGVKLQFAGYPDPKGEFKTDLGKAPKLAQWVTEPGNKELMRETLASLFACHDHALLAPVLGWYTSCFWRMLFHRVYTKFPSLHIAGAAGAGKSELNFALMRFFFYEAEVKSVTPTTTIYALQKMLSGSSSIPLMYDEYKPSAMKGEYHGQMKLVIRDVYNCRDVSKGGGNRDHESYKALHNIQLSAPLIFIAEAIEDEAATMERVVLGTVVKPAASVSVKRMMLFLKFKDNAKLLAIIGQYIAAKVLTSYTLESFHKEFDVIYNAARAKFRMTEADLTANLSKEVMQAKQSSNERTVFNYAVAEFGLTKLREVVDAVYDEGQFKDTMDSLASSVYNRMGDLQKATQAEYLKVLSIIASMSYSVEDTRPEAIRRGNEYQFTTVGGKDAIEISARTVYVKYRMYCRSAGLEPLFPAHESFCLALKDSPAFMKYGMGTKLTQPQIYTFNLEELAKLNVETFKGA